MTQDYNEDAKEWGAGRRKGAVGKLHNIVVYAGSVRREQFEEKVKDKPVVLQEVLLATIQSDEDPYDVCRQPRY